jgi:hypothetical protein
MKAFVVGLVLSASVLAGAAQADIYKFELTPASGDVFSFTLDSSVAPDPFDADTFTYANVATQVGAQPGTIDQDYTFYVGGPNNAGFDAGPKSYIGPQLFTGDTSGPIFLTGTFGLNVDGQDVLTITNLSAVPEPAGWALMMLGLGGAGAALRARRQRRVAVPA